MDVKIETSTSQRLKEAMELRDMKQADLVRLTGIDKASISLYVSGKYSPKGDKLYKLAMALNVSSAWLSGFNVPMQDDDYYSSNLKSPDITEDVVTFPVIGEIAAGYDEIAVEDWSGDTVDIPTSYLKGRKKEDFFVLSVHGDSMYPMYLNGDKVLILKQNTLDHSGDVGAILYEGECATLKKVEYVQGEDWLRLVPINPEYQPKLIEGPDLELCRVIGIPRLLVREID